RRGSSSYKVPLNGGIAPQDFEREEDRTQGDEHPSGDAEARAVRTDGNRDQQTAQDDEEQSAELLDPEHGCFRCVSGHEYVSRLERADCGRQHETESSMV